MRIAPVFDPLQTCGFPEGGILVDAGAADFYLMGPAFFDPQVNGYAGIDFQDPDLTREGLEHAAEEIRRHGCAAFLLTLITADAQRLEDQLRRVDAMIRENAFLEWAIPGI